MGCFGFQVIHLGILWVSDRDQVKGLVVSGEVKSGPYLVIVKCADDHPVQPEGDGL